MRNEKYTIAHHGRIAEIFVSYRKSGSSNTIMTSDLRAEVEMWPFRACAMHPAMIIGRGYGADTTFHRA